MCGRLAVDDRVKTIVGDQAFVNEAIRAGVAEASTLRFDRVAAFNVTDNGPQLTEHACVA
ncbi:hypothetical protein ABCS02_28130 [Microbacterium sp. X-17]|uniref:hypothetical protein n=1 Tax=Microbacterium sp. X-17 TaxID=3144404 RepID=UPI0031F4F51B